MRDHHAAIIEARCDLFQALRDIVIAEPVKPIAPHALVIIALRQGKGVIHPRMRPVECGIETGDLRCIRKRRARRADTGKAIGLVQRRKGDKARQRFNHAVINADRFRIDRATMHHPMPDGADMHVGQIFPRDLKKSVDCLIMGFGIGQRPVDRPPPRRLRQQTRRVTQAFDLPAPTHTGAIVVHQLIQREFQ